MESYLLCNQLTVHMTTDQNCPLHAKSLRHCSSFFFYNNFMSLWQWLTWMAKKLLRA